MQLGRKNLCAAKNPGDGIKERSDKEKAPSPLQTQIATLRANYLWRVYEYIVIVNGQLQILSRTETEQNVA